MKRPCALAAREVGCGQGDHAERLDVTVVGAVIVTISLPLELPLNDDQKLYTNLTTYVSNACNNKLVTPGNPAQSALVTILSGPCG